MRKSSIIVTINIIFLLIIFFELQFIQARHKAIAYLNIINVDSVAYINVKSAIEDIVPDDVRVCLFESSVYPYSNKPAYHFQIHSVKGSMIGFSDYKFDVDWTIYRHQAKKLTTQIIVEDGIVINASRIK